MISYRAVDERLRKSGRLVMVSYRAAAERLYKLVTLAQIAITYQELVGPLPEGRSLAGLPLSDMIPELGEKLEAMFPVHYDMLYDYARCDDAILEMPFAHFVHFGGLDAEPGWEDWDPPFQLVFALFEAGNSEPTFSAYPEIFRWWEEQSRHHDLPPLADLDYARIRERLESLPEPWDGLWAIAQWAEGDTGNLFADVPCEYAHEMAFNLDWGIESIRWLEGEYKRAEYAIFAPSWNLVEICRQHPEALGICFDLALGRRPRNGWAFQNGELAIMELNYEQR